MKKLGFGLMRLPHPDPDDWSRVDMEQVKQMVDAYMAAGFSYFDTAYIYHRGQSEKVFGELVASRYPRDRFVLTTKMPVFMAIQEEDYERIFEEQLSYCQVEYFDYYFLHAVGKEIYPKIVAQKGFEFLLMKKKEGKTKHIGFSYHDDAETLDRILTEHPEIEVVQLQLNYVDWDSEGIQSGKCYEVCAKHHVQVTVMEPLKGGALVNLPEAAREVFLKEDKEASMASWGIRFAASFEHVMVVLSGMSTLEQLLDNISYMQDFKPLSDQEQLAVKKTVRLIHDSIAIPCTACRYCTDGCPKGIAIPDYFTLFNQQKQFGFAMGLDLTFKNLTASHGKPSDCIRCKKCEKHCPQHLRITKHLQDVAKVFEKEHFDYAHYVTEEERHR
ncbi:MAG: aldo/keto reductase [Lachnospiraceae bacterium]|nr:aldo/keto reductase [Lachnospiraceae bacterium]